MSGRCKVLLLLFTFMLAAFGTCVLASPGGQRGFFGAWWGAKSSFQLWTPLDMPNLIGWWTVTDTESISTVAGTNTISEWRDKSGNDNHLTQSTAARRPFYTVDDITGQNVVSFNSLNSSMFLTNNIGGSDKFYSILFRFRNSSGISVIFVSGGSNLDYYQSSSGWFVGGRSLTVPYSTNEFTMRSAWTSVSGQNQKRYSNAVATAEGAYQGSLGMSAIGDYFNRNVNISVREFVYVDGEPSESDRQKLEGYMAWNSDMEDKLPDDHPYKSSPPTKE